MEMNQPGEWRCMWIVYMPPSPHTHRHMHVQTNTQCYYDIIDKGRGSESAWCATASSMTNTWLTFYWYYADDKLHAQSSARSPIGLILENLCFRIYSPLLAYQLLPPHIKELWVLGWPLGCTRLTSDHCLLQLTIQETWEDSSLNSIRPGLRWGVSYTSNQVTLRCIQIINVICFFC